MEKPSRAKATKIFSFLPKPTSFSISHPPLSPGREKSSKPKAFRNKAKAYHKKAFSGPIISIVPVEVRRKEKNGGSFDAQEPTSPKVSCMGRLKNKKVCRSKRSSTPQQERKPPTFIVRKMFRRKLRPSRRTDAAESSEGRPAVAGREPLSLGQMKRFTSGRETLRNFDWREADRRQKAATGDREDSYSDEESDEELYHSAPILVGGGVVALEPRKEVNLWKRRTLAPPIPLQLN